MNDLSIRITHRAAQDCNPAETTIELGTPFPQEIPVAFLDGIAAIKETALKWSNTLCAGKNVTQADAEKACAALGEGWRLPTRPELESIIDLSHSSPAIDTTRFPDTKNDWYWTSTPCAWSSDRAWCVDFVSGFVCSAHRNGAGACVRAVRSVPAGQ